MEEENFNPSDEQLNEESSHTEKKRRGRPPRAKQADENEISEKQPAKKRRGRPARAKLQEQSADELFDDNDISENPELVRESAHLAAASAVQSARALAQSRKSARKEEDDERRNAIGEAVGTDSENADDFDENSEANIFVHHNDGDEFAYNRADKDEETDDDDDDGQNSDMHGQGQSRNRRGAEEDDEVPQYFSTTDEDLNPDNYTKYSEEDSDYDSEKSRNQDESENSDTNSDIQERPENRQWRQNQRNQRNQNQRGQNNQRDNRNQNGREYQQNQRGEWRDGRNQQNQQGNWQQNRFQRDNRNQQNQRGQQNNQRGQQNNQQNRQNQRDNRNQQNQRGQNNQRAQQNNQQNRQNQRDNRNLQKQKNIRLQKIQITGVQEDAMNPANLPDWNVLKTRASIADWLAESYFDIKKEAPKPELFKREEPSLQESAPESFRAEKETLEEKTAGEGSETLVSSAEDKNLQEEDLLSAAAEVSATDEQTGACTPENTQVSAAVEQDTVQNAEVKTPPAEEPYDPSAAPLLKISEEHTLEALTDFNELYNLSLKEIQGKFDELGIEYTRGSGKSDLMAAYFDYAKKQKKLVLVKGVLDVFENSCGGAITYESDSYKLRRSCVYVPQGFITKYRLQRGHEISMLAAMPREIDATGANCAIAVKLVDVAGGDPAGLENLTPFTDLTPYYPTKRIIMEAPECAKWDNLSMRAVDLLTPVGRGQRALIVAPPRTGKTVLMQAMAKSIALNSPDIHLMILLVDERPEEVTDFKRNVDGEVISSTFDEDAHSHVHAAEMVISKARRMVEAGKDVVILLDSITRLARAYNALMPNGGRTMSGGVDASALQKPKRFFGSARNIEGGGSLTIIGTALVETGSKMDDVIFEEFKGTGNLELHLDRQLSDKRIFPAINIEKSGTRKEELLYHPDEMKKIYSLRRAMKGVPTTEAMEMLVQRLKKVKTNVEFLIGLNS